MYKAIVPAVVAFVSLTTPVSAQVAGFSDVPANHWAADSVTKLVTAGILQGPPKTAGKPAKPAYNGNKPVTRYELAVTLYRFVQYIERADGQPRSKQGVEMNGPAAIKALIAGGYLPKNSPLAKEGNKVVTANQLADAMTTVIAKAREKVVPITPGSKFGPDEKSR